MTEPFVRRLRLRHDGAAVEADLEDHVHHFGVRVEHDGRVVTAVRPRAVRWPWTTCPEALDALDALVGSEIGRRPLVDDPRQHCTHALDVTRWAIRFAGDPTPARTITVSVAGWDTPTPEVTVEAEPPEEAPEIEQLAKRARWMSMVRGMDLDDYETIDESGLPQGVCYSSQPERQPVALRNRGSSLAGDWRRKNP